MNAPAAMFLILIVFLALTDGCSSLPKTTTTGKIADVVVTDEAVSPQDVTVQPGDEVKIVNKRTGPIWVYFSRDHLNELSCERGFSYFWGIEESAKIKPDESASLCFTKAGVYGYWIQTERTVQGGARPGKDNIPGATPAAVIVGSGLP